MCENMKKDGEMEFPAFPYKPYSIQLDFMKFLYQSLERGGISVLESPTGMSPRLACLIFFFFPHLFALSIVVFSSRNPSLFYFSYTLDVI